MFSLVFPGYSECVKRVVSTCEDNCDGVVVYPKKIRVRLPFEDTL